MRRTILASCGLILTLMFAGVAASAAPEKDEPKQPAEKKEASKDKAKKEEKPKPPAKKEGAKEEPAKEEVQKKEEPAQESAKKETKEKPAEDAAKEKDADAPAADDADDDAADSDGKDAGPESNTEGAVAKGEKPPAGPKVFDEAADARQQIDQAVHLARETHKQVLLVFGHNWCHWCVRLHELFHQNAEVAQQLTDHYVVAWIDTSQLRRRAELGRKYSEEVVKQGVPFLAILSPDGAVVKLQGTGTFEDEDHYAAEKVAHFLSASLPRPITAENELVSARGRAALEDKAVFVQCVTETGDWCQKLEAFVDAHAEELTRDYVSLKIDIAQEREGGQVARRLGRKSDSGVPWMAIVSAEGDVLITSEGPTGNIGYPVEPKEIDHFVEMLKKTARHSSKEELAQLEAALRQAGEKIAAARNQTPEAAPAAAARND